MHTLLLHGAIGSMNQLEGIKKTLPEEMNAHLMNFSGHGGEPIPSDAFSIPLFAKDVLNFLDRRSIATVNIFGYSMGGYVALFLARHFPDRISGILTLGTKFSWTRESAEKESRMLDPDILQEKFPDFSKSLHDRHAPADWKIVLKKTQQMMLALGDHPALIDNDLRQIRQQVMICVGEKDKMVTQSESLDAASHLPNGTFKMLKDTKHPIEAVEVEMISNEIRSFFGQA